jgi:hypothetical protein
VVFELGKAVIMVLRGCLALVPTCVKKSLSTVLRYCGRFAGIVCQVTPSISATQDYALNLSILLSAGKENNSDFLSNGE